MTFLPLLKVKFSANAAILNCEIAALASFELIPVKFIIEMLFYFPDDEPLSMEFAQVGIESVALLPNLGFKFYVGCLYVVLIPVCFLLRLLSLCC